MKRVLVASIFGIASAVHSYGAGQVYFSTYLSSAVIAPVVFDKTEFGHVAGQPVPLSAGVEAELYYGLGSGLNFSQLTGLPSSITPVGVALPGVISGPLLTLPDWNSGPITFGILAFSNFYGSDNFVTWTETGSSPLTFTPSLLEAAYPNGIIVTALPEPSTFALTGFSASALLISRRWKNLRLLK